MRWCAPILSFTAQEAWEAMPGERDEFVFTSTWFDKLQELDEASSFNSDYWQRMLTFRNEANKAIETARNNGVIGGSLEACVKIYTKGQLLEDLKKLESELCFVLITSKAEVVEGEAPADGFKSDVIDCGFSVTKSEAKKCERCWHYEDSVDADPEYPGLCKRCIENIKSSGEVRHFA